VKTDIITKEWKVQNIIPLIKEVPDAKYVVVNVANSIGLSDEDTELIRKTDIVFDTSGRALMGNDSLGDLLKRFGREKFAFGTHSPVLDYLTGLLRIESMNNAEADEDTKELVRSGNARRIIGL
jgi:predicted TIM-barrel fold metal-dependent hydrolase